MYQQLASKLYIASGSSEVSQPVSMEGFNAARIDMTLFTSGGTVTALIQESNDLENWTNHSGGGQTSATGPTYKLFDTVSSLSSAYVRVKWTATTAGAIIAGGINLSTL